MYFVYILTNPSKTVLYTGVTNSLSRRLFEHHEIRGARTSFTGKYSCFNLVYYEQYESILAAIEREKEIKKWRRGKKVNLITAVNPRLDFLNDTVFD